MERVIMKDGETIVSIKTNLFPREEEQARELRNMIHRLFSTLVDEQSKSQDNFRDGVMESISKFIEEASDEKQRQYHQDQNR